MVIFGDILNKQVKRVNVNILAHELFIYQHEA